MGMGSSMFVKLRSSIRRIMRPLFAVTPGLRVRHINTWRLATVVEVSDDATETFLLRFVNGREELCELSDFETCYGLSLAKHDPCLAQPASSPDHAWKVGSAEVGAGGGKKRGKRKPAESLKPWPKNAGFSEGQQWETQSSVGLSDASRSKQAPWETQEDGPEKT